MSQRRRGIFAGCGLLGIGILFLFQNATVVDFTHQPQKKRPMTAIEKAIAQSEREQSLRQKQNGVSPEQTQKKLRKNKRTPAAIGDIPFYERSGNKTSPTPAAK